MVKVIKNKKPPDTDISKGKIKRDDFLEANHALLQAHSLIDISQESYTNAGDDNIYNLLGVLNEKIDVALDFFSNNDLCWETDMMSKKDSVT